MDALLALVRDRPAAFTTQPISREFDEAGVKRDRRWLEELREREHVRDRPTRLLPAIWLRLLADGNEECRDLIFPEIELPRHADRIKPDHRRSAQTHRLRGVNQSACAKGRRSNCLVALGLRLLEIERFRW